jgi:hypothetical protein
LTLVDQEGNQPVQMAFDNVTTPGLTSVTTSSTPPPAGAPLGFSLGDPPRYYDIHTTAVLGGSVEVCVSVPWGGLTQEQYEQQRLLHFTAGVWHDVTTRVDSNQGQVCGRTSSFSPFVVGLPVTKPSDLRMHLPANITIPANTYLGAKVSYAKPTVTGSLPGNPAATCTPKSGATFPIGATTVTCTLVDSRYANSPVTATFQVNVQSAAQQLADLRLAVVGVGSGTALKTKVEAVQAKLARGDSKGACRGLLDFGVELALQLTKKKVTVAQALTFGASAVRIAAVLRC